jgi:hypothetical protein
MARSKRKNPFVPLNNATSEKKDKQVANRQQRRVARHAIETGKEIPCVAKTGSWVFSKDGKVRINPKEQPRLMRK